MTETTTAKKPKKPIWKRWWAIAIAALLLVGIGSTIANSGKGATDAADAEQVVASQPAEQPSEQASASATPAARKAEKPVPAEYASALIKATQYSEMMHMSKKGIYAQLTSSYGEQFSKKAAKFAVKHVDANWNRNALAKAQDYQEQQAMSPNAIHDQLTSSYGEQFTAEQADYAIKHLND